MFVTVNGARRTWIKVIGHQVRQPGKFDIAACGSDLINLRLATWSYWRRVGVIGVHDEDRNMREGSNLSRCEIPVTTCLQLDDASDRKSVV